VTDSKRGNAQGASPLTHNDAEALISARLDGPLDPAQNRALLAHLASCNSCRSFATQMDTMTTAVRALPSLPPSTAVSRRVRSEIRGETAPLRRFTKWITTSKAAPMGAMAGATVALALVTASVFGPLGDDNGNGSSVNAPNVAVMQAETSTAEASARTTDYGNESAMQLPNLQVPPDSEAPTAALATGEPVGNGAVETQANPETADSQESTADNNSSNAPGNMAAASGPSTENDSAAKTPSDTAAILGDGTGRDDTPVTLADDEATPVPTETSAPEPTATAEPSPTEEATATTEPAPTETANEEPDPTSTPEPSPTATEAPPTPDATSTPATPVSEPTSTATETAEPTPAEDDGDSPAIVPRGDDNESESSGVGETSATIASSEGETTTDESAAAGTGAAGSSESAIQSTESTAESELELAEEDSAQEPEPAEPVQFSEMDAVGVMSSNGLLLPGNGGLFAAEQPGGGLSIVAADGSMVTSGWGYNPIWSEDGQTLYAADGSLSEAGAALISWSAGGGPNYITSGAPAFDTPAGARDGGLFYVRYQPGAEFSLQLRFTGGEDRVVWEAGSYELTGQGIYLFGSEVFVPTNQGWIAIPTGGGAERNVGATLGGEFDQVVDPASGMIAFVSGDTVYIAPASSPGSATSVGSLNGGGFAWTPWGLALASGSEVSIITPDGRSTPIITGGGALTAPSWNGSELRVADSSDGGSLRSIPIDLITGIVGG
jgi:hypothetical protein